MPCTSADAECAGRAARGGRPAQLLARGRRQPDVARQVDDVRYPTRNVAAVDLRHGPDDVGEGHRREAERQQHQRPARDWGCARVHQQYAARQQHCAVQRDVALRQHVLEHVRVVLGGGGWRDHAEPEECAEAEQQDRGVEPESRPLHANRGGADDGQHRREDERVEGEEEHVADRRERVHAEQPVGRVQQVAHRIDTDRGREQPPGAPRRRVGGAARRGPGEDGHADARDRVGIQVERVQRRPSPAVDEDQQDRDRDVGEQRDRHGAGPARTEPLTLAHVIVRLTPWRHILLRPSPIRSGSRGLLASSLIPHPAICDRRAITPATPVTWFTRSAPGRSRPGTPCDAPAGETALRARGGPSNSASGNWRSPLARRRARPGVRNRPPAAPG